MTQEIEFESEFILHMLTQKHLKELFDLEFIASEIQIHNLRLDNLAFDAKTDSPVIIEYKNEFNANVLQQCQDYYDMVSDKPDKLLKRLSHMENIDFEKTRVMIIGPEFTDRQIENAKHYFELWKITLFDNGKVTYENLKTDETRILDVNLKELKLTEEKLLDDKSPEMKELYFRLKNRISSEFDDVEIRSLVDAFSLRTDDSLMCVAVFLKSSFNINIFEDDLENADNLTDISQKSTGGNAKYQLKYKSDDDLDYFIDIIRQVYNQKKARHEQL